MPMLVVKKATTSSKVGSDGWGRWWPADVLLETVGDAYLVADASVIGLVITLSYAPMKTNAGTPMGALASMRSMIPWWVDGR